MMIDPLDVHLQLTKLEPNIVGSSLVNEMLFGKSYIFLPGDIPFQIDIKEGATVDLNEVQRKIDLISFQEKDVILRLKEKQIQDSLRSILLSEDPMARGITALFSVLFTLVNDIREKFGETRIDKDGVIQLASQVLISGEV